MLGTRYQINQISYHYGCVWSNCERGVNVAVVMYLIGTLQLLQTTNDLPRCSRRNKMCKRDSACCPLLRVR